MNLYPHEKPRPPLELQLLTSLRSRMHLTPSQQRSYKNLKKGYIGELKFYNLLKNKLPSNHLLLNSLSLNSSNSEFQMDSLLMCQNTIYLFEVKNFEGDFYIHKNNWYVYPSGKEINNPIIQLKRSESLLRQLVQLLGYNFSIESHVVFINPEFVLFQAPLNLPILLPGQVNRFINNITDNQITPINLTNKFANSLIDSHIERSPHERLPNYHYDQLKKGITCQSCSGFLAYLSPSKLYCSHCNHESFTDSAVLRSAEEFKELFPEKQITTGKIYEWCGIVPSKKIIRRILAKKLVRVGNRKATYYIFKD